MTDHRSTTIQTLRLRTAQATETRSHRTALRLRASAWLRMARLHPPGLPPAAILHVRSMPDPLPNTTRPGTGVRPPDEWLRAARSALEEVARTAPRPTNGHVPASPDAVVFENPSQQRACLLLDLARGVAPDRWWWQAVLDEPMKTIITSRAISTAALTNDPNAIPGAIAYLCDWQHLPTVLQAVSAADAMAAVSAMAGEYGVAVSSRSVDMAAARGQTAHPGSKREDSGPPRERVPWSDTAERAVPSNLPPAVRMLAAVALDLFHRPHRSSRLLQELGYESDASASPDRAGSHAEEPSRATSSSSDVVPPYHPPSARVSDGPSLRDAASSQPDVRPGATDAASSIDIRGRTGGKPKESRDTGWGAKGEPHDESSGRGRKSSPPRNRDQDSDSMFVDRDHGEENIQTSASETGTDHSPFVDDSATKTKQRESVQGGRDRDENRSPVERKAEDSKAVDGDGSDHQTGGGRRRELNPPHDDGMDSPVSFGEIQKPQEAQRDAKSADPPGTDGSTMSGGNEKDRDNAFAESLGSRMHTRVLASQLGGVVYVVNLLDALGWTGLPVLEPDESGTKVRGEAGPWAVLEAVVRAMLGDDLDAYADDPLWAALAQLDAREETETAGSDLFALGSFVAPPDAVKQIGGPGPKIRWFVHRGRLRLWSDAVLLADVPVEDSTQAQRPPHQAEAVFARFQETTNAPIVLVASNEPDPWHEGRPLPGVSLALRQWTRCAMPLVRRRLFEALGRNTLGPDGDESLQDLLAENATIHLAPMHVDVTLPMDAVSLDVRLSGLDRDPGWLPAFGRVVHLHFS